MGTSRRHLLLRRTAGVLGGVALALAMGNALFSWWMEQDWQVYRALAKSKGLVIDLPAPMGDTVPREENLYAAWPFAGFETGENGSALPRRKLDWQWLPYDLLPTLSTGRGPDWNAAHARLLQVSAGTVGQCAGPAEATLRICEERIGDEWRDVLRAEARPAAQFRLQSWHPLQNKRPNLQGFRIAGQTHAIRAVALLERGESKAALEEISGIVRLSEALRSHPSLVSTMIRGSLLRIAMEPIWQGLMNNRWRDEELAVLDRVFAETSASIDFTRTMDHERAWLNSVIDHLISEPGFSRHGLLRQYFSLGDGRESAIVLSFSDGYLRSNQILINRVIDSVRLRVDGRGDFRPEHEASIENAGEHDIHSALASALLPKFARAESRLIAIEARLRQARVAVAIERSRRSGNDLPSELAELVPKFLAAVPADPFDGAAMRYSLAPGGDYRLWSIGTDRKDSGGVPDPEDGIDVEGDLVWRGSSASALRTADAAPGTESSGS